MSKSGTVKSKKNPEAVFAEAAVLAVSILSDAIYKNTGDNELAAEGELNDIRTAFHKDITCDRWRKRDIFGPKGAVFVASVMRLFVEDYKNSKRTGQHKFIDAIRDYCYGFRHFESTYYFYKQLGADNEFVKATDYVFGRLTNLFLSDASDNSNKDKVREIAVLCTSFLVLVFHNTTFVSRTPIKAILYEELVRKLGMEGLFTGVPELREQFMLICSKLNEVSTKKKTKPTSTSSPTDGEGQKSTEQSGQIKAMIDDVGDSINDNDDISNLV